MATKDELHPVVEPANSDKMRSSGRDMGLVKPPAVSVNPRSDNPQQRKAPKAEIKPVSGAVDHLFDDSMNSDYGDLELDVGGGSFVEVEINKSIDELEAKINKHVYRLNQHYSVPVKDEDGDEIWDIIVERKLLRNDDGTIRMTGDGKKAYEANQTSIPRVIQLRQYAAKVVTAGSNKEIGNDVDGVLIIRVF